LQINAARREVYFKLVYYGPGLSGKTTNIQVIHKKAPEDRKGPLTAIATEGDRTLFFDYMPLELGTVNGLRTKFQLYSVPGQKYYDATRKLVLQGVDGVCFVADSQAEKMAENVESLENLAFHLGEQGIRIEQIPLVIQWNKRDLPDALPVEDLELKLNKWGAPTFEAVAVTGEGVFPTLKKLAQLVLARLAAQQGAKVVEPPTPPPAKPIPRPIPAAPHPTTAPTVTTRPHSERDIPTTTRPHSERDIPTTMPRAAPVPASEVAPLGALAPWRPFRSLLRALKKILEVLFHRR
jgi:signal recognition particle receptor subunit beta